jgi:hypothetical protein
MVCPIVNLVNMTPTTMVTMVYFSLSLYIVNKGYKLAYHWRGAVYGCPTIVNGIPQKLVFSDNPCGFIFPYPN